MWLAANQKPDFRTINAFRGERLKSVIEEVFTATVKLLYEKGYVKLEKYFVDGTKIESAANKYTFAMKNGQLKPGYNVQVGNENTFAIGYDIFADAADMRTLPVHIDNVQKRLEHTFEMVIADAGYGSEENYEYLERNGSVALVKYGSYHVKQGLYNW